MRKVSGLLGAFVLALFVASCGGGDSSGVGGPPPPPPPPPTCPANTFCMTSTTFSPTSLTVAHGTTVRWTNDTGILHNVKWTDAAGSSAALAGDGTGDIGDYSTGSHTRLFNTPGTYNFYCTIHGTPTSGMHGTLTVQ